MWRSWRSIKSHSLKIARLALKLRRLSVLRNLVAMGVGRPVEHSKKRKKFSSFFQKDRSISRIWNLELPWSIFFRTLPNLPFERGGNFPLLSKEGLGEVLARSSHPNFFPRFRERNLRDFAGADSALFQNIFYFFGFLFQFFVFRANIAKLGGNILA